MNPNVLRRARDLYAVYCASSDGKSFMGTQCPAWEGLTEAVRGHWYTVALRTVQLGRETANAGTERNVPPNSYTLGHLSSVVHALEVWRRYSGLEVA